MKCIKKLECIFIFMGIVSLVSFAQDNPVTNPGFEELDSNGWATGWEKVGSVVEISTREAHSGKSSCHLVRTPETEDAETGLNRDWKPDSGEQGSMLVQKKGWISFWYKAIKGKGNLHVYIIPMSSRPMEDTGEQRFDFTIPVEHVGDGKWHQGWIKYDYSGAPKVKWVHISPRILGREGEIYLDDFAYVEKREGQASLKEGFFSEPESMGEEGEIKASVANIGDMTLSNVKVELKLPSSIKADKSTVQTIENIPAGAAKTIFWRVSGVSDKAEKARLIVYDGKGEVVQSKELTLRISSGVEKGLVAWWKFDEGSGTSVRDWSGNGFDGEMVGNVEWVKGLSGNAISFNGGYVEVPFDEKLQLGKAISIQLWIYPTDYEPDTYKHLVELWDSYLLRFDNPPEGGRPSFFVFLDGVPEPRVQGKIPELNKWHCITAVWDGKNSQIWINGVKTETARAGKPTPKQKNLLIGQNFIGLIDEVKIFNRALKEDEIIANLPPNPKLSSLKVSNVIAETGKPFTISAEISNEGGKPARDGIAELILPQGLILVEGEKKVSIPSLSRKEPRTITWKVKADTPIASNAGVKVSFAGFDQIIKSNKFVVARPIPEEGGIFDKPTAIKIGEDFILGNSRVRMVFPKNNFGYGVFALDLNKEGRWKRIVVSNAMSFLAVKKGQDVIRKFLYANEANAIASGKDTAGIEFKGSTDDGAGARWSYKFVFSIANDDRIKVVYEAIPDNNGLLVHLQGPMLYAGEGSFGAKKNDGLFCGLEWLVGDERSSSNLDMHDPDYYIRYVPHGNKPTIPFMAVSEDSCAIALMWDALQKWDGKNIRPAAVYASPNFLDGQENHLMGLFLPSVIEYLGQNNLEAIENPYPFKKGVPLKIESYIVAAAPVKGSIDCLKRWFDTFGVTDPAPLPRGNYIKEIEFSMRAYLESLWIESEKQWWTSKGGGQMSQKGIPPSFAFQLKMASVMTKDEGLRKKYLEMVERTMKLGGFSTVWGEDAGFTWANPAASILGFGGQAGSHLDSMWEDGSWRFRTYIGTTFPFKGYDYSLLGPDKAAEVGTCARKAYEVLRYVRMTGDMEVFNTVKKSLEFMKQFNVPRAAQVWECPVHSPDILASADAIDAYIEAYRFTGEKQYLDEAIRWAWTGLPFVYFWNEPGHYMMRYASIAIFGGSWYSGSWIGQPVQWNGLRYAYAILKLADYDKTFPWKKIGEGITISAMYQQDEEGPNVALWPDNFSTANWSKCGWVFEPGMILKNVYKILDRDLEPMTYNAGEGKERLYINARAKISDISWKEGNLRFNALFPEGEGGGYILIASIARPEKVSVNGQEFSEDKNIYENRKDSWKYESGQGFLVIRINSTGPDTVEIKGAKYRFVTIIPKQTDKIDFGFDSDLEGWSPVNQIDNMTSEEGVMKGTATGGDPYMHRARVKVDGNLYRTIKVRSRANTGNGIAIYWITEDSPDWAEDKVIHLRLYPDNEFHEYIFEVGKHKMWAGKKITGIRLDPVEGGNGGTFEVDFIKGE